MGICINSHIIEQCETMQGINKRFSRESQKGYISAAINKNAQIMNLKNVHKKSPFSRVLMPVLQSNSCV